MKLQPELFIVFVHILLTLVYLAFIFSGRSHLRREQIIPIFFVPVFGPITAFVIEMLNVFRIQGTRPVELEPLSLGDDILWVPLKSFHEKGDIVPLEEAILINDVKARRRAMLETLYTDPLKYLDILNIAKYNDDVETSHYATTTISKAQKDFQLSIQKLAVSVENNPDDLDLLDEYIETLENAKDDRDAMIKKLRNCIKLSEYSPAFEIGDYLIENWHEDERSWIEAIRVCVDGQDGNKLQEILLKMRNRKINWTRDGKEHIKVWLEETAQ
jgi:hypothetical protein